MVTHDVWRTQIEEMRDALYDETLHIAASFKEERDAEAVLREKEEKSYHYSIRVEKTNAGVSVRWYQNNYVGKKGERVARHIYLKRGAEYMYSAAVFKKAHEWERDLIMATEEKLRAIRVRSTMLGLVAQNVANFFTAETDGKVVRKMARDIDRETEAEATLTGAPYAG